MEYATLGNTGLLVSMACKYPATQEYQITLGGLRQKAALKLCDLLDATDTQPAAASARESYSVDFMFRSFIRPMRSIFVISRDTAI